MNADASDISLVLQYSMRVSVAMYRGKGLAWGTPSYINVGLCITYFCVSHLYKASFKIEFISEGSKLSVCAHFNIRPKLYFYFSLSLTNLLKRTRNENLILDLLSKIS